MKKKKQKIGFQWNKNVRKCRVQSYMILDRGEEIACNLVAACRLSLGRPRFLMYNHQKYFCMPF